MRPTNLPPWPAVYQQTQRWIEAGVSAAMVHDLRVLLRWSAGRADQPTAAIIDSATRQSTPQSRHRAGYDGHKRRKGSQAARGRGHLALARHPVDAGDRAEVTALAAEVQAVTGQTVEVAFVDQGYTDKPVAATAAAHGIQLEVVTLPEAKRGFVLPRCWVVERSFAWRHAAAAWLKSTDACRKRSPGCVLWSLPA